MINLISGLTGTTIVLLVIADLLLTALRLEGGGIFSFRVADTLWNLVHRNRYLATHHQFLSNVSFAILLLTILLWLILLWLGWILIFSASPYAIIDSDTEQPADLWDRAYFVGYTLTTLGLGDYRANGGFWQIITVITSANGFFFISLIVSYIIPLVNAVAEKRQFAAYLTTLGPTPAEILIRAWNGQDFGLLTQHLVALTPKVIALEQEHLAYPIIHCIHDHERKIASAPAIAVLSETLLLLEHGIAPAHRPDPVALYPLRAALAMFLATLGSAFIQAAPEPPSTPALAQLRRHGIPTVSNADFQQAVAALAKERSLLLAQVEHDGWAWSDVIGAEAAIRDVAI